jgi:hypothetical protein
MNNPRPDRQSQDKILSAERRMDFAHTLAKIEWDIFTTLTFQNPVPRPQIAYGMAFQWLRCVGEICAVPYGHLLIALRGEQGEKNGRFHFHCLVGGTTTRNKITLSHQLEHRWRVVSGNAISQVRPYDSSLAGTTYISKCLGANEYEVSKYTLANQVTLSHSVLSVIRGMDAKGERRHSEHIRKNRQVIKAKGLYAQPHPSVSSLDDETVCSPFSA